jgi:hypothetical protein
MSPVPNTPSRDEVGRFKSALAAYKAYPYDFDALICGKIHGLVPKAEARPSV